MFRRFRSLPAAVTAALVMTGWTCLYSQAAAAAPQGVPPPGALPPGMLPGQAMPGLPLPGQAMPAQASPGQTPEVANLQVELLTRAVSKLPLFIAYEEGLYAKHGVFVQFWMPAPEYLGGIVAEIQRPAAPDLSVDGGTPMMVNMTTNASYPPRVILASTDCSVRWHIIGKKGMKGPEELKGKRLGISGMGAMTSFIALLFAQRMGWDPKKDIAIMSEGHLPEHLRSGKVDAFVADERYYAAIRKEGFPILADTSKWGATIAGNSIRAERAWLEKPQNREAARRFIKATAEGLALFHKNRELAVGVLMKWHGLDRETATVIYNAGASMQKKPYPCYDGIKKTMELFDSAEMRKHKYEDFFDDSFVKELDQSGFLDELYK